jgi:hypothetical protein
VIALPLFAGAVHETVASRLPGTADTPVGADGTDVAAAIDSNIAVDKNNAMSRTHPYVARRRLRPRRIR